MVQLGRAVLFFGDHPCRLAAEQCHLAEGLKALLLLVHVEVTLQFFSCEVV